MDNTKNKNKEFEYTIVLNGNYIDNGEQHKIVKRQVAAPQAAGEQAGSQAGEARIQDQSQDTSVDAARDRIDRLYYDYEKMCLKDPTVLDKDDIYPHSYQWRLGDKYDEGKVPVLEEALRTGKRILETESYEKYIAAIKNRKFTPDSWD